MRRRHVPPPVDTYDTAPPISNPYAPPGTEVEPPPIHTVVIGPRDDLSMAAPVEPLIDISTTQPLYIPPDVPLDVPMEPLQVPNEPLIVPTAPPLDVSIKPFFVPMAPLLDVPLEPLPGYKPDYKPTMTIKPEEKQEEKKEVEVEIDFSHGSRTNTDVQGDYSLATSATFWDNDIIRITHLDRLPNLQRLSLKHNDLETLRGLSPIRMTLRWLDLSSNNLESLDGLGDMPHLHTLDASTNNLKRLRGLGACPSLKSLDVHNNDLKNLNDIKGSPNITHLYVYTNDLPSLKPVGQMCRSLQVIDVHNNDIDDVSSVIAIAEACKSSLLSIDMAMNDFSAEEREKIRRAFQGVDRVNT